MNQIRIVSVLSSAALPLIREGRAFRVIINCFLMTLKRLPIRFRFSSPNRFSRVSLFGEDFGAIWRAAIPSLD